MKYLYKYRADQGFEDANPVSQMQCKTFTPKCKKGGMLLPGETGNIKLLGTRLLFQIMTLGRAKIFYISNSEDLVHTSYVVPRCFKFAFMGRDDYEIGPCMTYPQYRGKGIYPSALRWICKEVGNGRSTFYMIVDEKNTASIRGMEKAGFKKYGIVKVTKFTKRYVLEQTL